MSALGGRPRKVSSGYGADTFMVGGRKGNRLCPLLMRLRSSFEMVNLSSLEPRRIPFTYFHKNIGQPVSVEQLSPDAQYFAYVAGLVFSLQHVTQIFVVNWFRGAEPVRDN